MQQLPLFPLGTVLVPGLVLPLHVFEPRYRDLVADLLTRPEGERAFGVVAIKEGHEVGRDGVRALYGVGCTAVVQDVTAYDDGRYDLVTTGSGRFRLDRLDETAGTPYLTGWVTPLPESDGEDVDVPALARQVGLAFAAYRERLGAPQTGLPASPRVLSYLVAAAMVLDLADRQALLEQPDTARRLVAERHLLHRERLLLDVLRAVPAPQLVRTAVSPN
ncbi:MAG: LON peptidase substrate-binding domain-containing protein [Actinomycetota bacterium]